MFHLVGLYYQRLRVKSKIGVPFLIVATYKTIATVTYVELFFCHMISLMPSDSCRHNYKPKGVFLVVTKTCNTKALNLITYFLNRCLT